jgi:protein SCO1/2
MSKPAPKSTFFYLQIVLGVLFVLVFSIRLFFQTPKELPVYYSMPDFTLTERSGKPITKTTLIGKVWIADFIFTKCAGQCPMMSAKMSRLSREMKDIFFVSFSVDPAFDTPEVLSHYADGYEADRQRWLFLTGPKVEINAVATGLKLNRIDEPMMHSINFMLIDRKGKVRGIYDAGDPARVSQLKRDAQFVKIEN